MGIDRALFNFFHSFAGVSPISDALIIFCAEYFPFIVGGALVVLLYTSRYSRLEQIRVFCTAVIAALIARTGIVEFLHAVVTRPRPFIALRFEPLIMEHSHSFPSGHAAFFFAFATAISFYNRQWGMSFFAAACVIAIARVMAGVHYPSDILAGALIGIGVGYLVVLSTRYFEKVRG